MCQEIFRGFDRLEKSKRWLIKWVWTLSRQTDVPKTDFDLGVGKVESGFNH